MAVNRINDILINGKSKAYNAYIFAADLNIGLIDGPTKFTVSFVAEDDSQIIEPELSATKPHRIQIGNIWSGNFYAVSRTYRKGSNGRVLEVTYVDGSVILDKIWVTLYKRGGDETTNLPGLIVVGHEIHPCDLNDDGKFDGTDAALLSWKNLDPCELKCPHDAASQEPVIENCINKEITDIFDVKYSFDELLNALEGVTQNAANVTRPVSYPIEQDAAVGTKTVNLALPALKINTASSKANRIKIAKRPTQINVNYLANYTGTLREVLRNWCSDFGWSFYWENDTLNFIDTKERPNIDFTNFANLESYTDTKTIEGTVGRGFISHYAHQGILAQTDCQQSRPLLLRCLTLYDLFGNYYKPIWNAIATTQGDYSVGSDPLSPPTPDAQDSSPDNQIEYRDNIYPQGVPIEKFEASCVCAFYDQNLRNLYNLWEYYGIVDPASASSKAGKWLDRLGQIKILAVLSEESTGDMSRKYQALIGNTYITKDKTALLSGKDLENFHKYKGYFVVALNNDAGQREDILNKQFRVEQNLASSFMGAHWYRAYVSPFYGETPQVFPNGQYFGALSTNVKDLPFAGFGHTYKSNVSKMVSSFVQRQRNDYRQYNGQKFSVNYAKNTSKKLVRSIVYFNKNTTDSWSPLQKSETQVSSLLKDLDGYAMKKKSFRELPENVVNVLVTQDGTSYIDKKYLDNLELYVFYRVPASGFKFSSAFKDNPNEEKRQYVEGLETYAVASAGLLDDKCLQYRINDVLLFTPAGASVQFARQSGFTWTTREPVNKDFETPAYKVFVTSTAKNRGIIPKAEMSFILPAPVENCLKVEYQVEEIERDALQFLNKLTNDCEINRADLLALHNKLSKNLNFSVTKPFRSIQYNIMGLSLPKTLSIRNGLESLSVRVDEKGIFTEISVGDSLFTPPSPSLIYKQLSNSIYQSVANLRKNSI